MEDEEIIEMFFERKESAIKEADAKYGALCNSISYNILKSAEDAKECVNDTMLRAWETIPPNRPKILSAYFAKIARNISLDRYRFFRRKKRDSFSEILEESDEIYISGATVEQQAEGRAVAEAVSCFLRGLAPKKRKMFLCRYWLCESTDSIAAKLNSDKGTVYTALSRIRKDLKEYLKKEGFDVE